MSAIEPIVGCALAAASHRHRKTAPAIRMGSENVATSRQRSQAQMRGSTSRAYPDQIVFQVISERGRGKHRFQRVTRSHAAYRAMQTGTLSELTRMVILETHAPASLAGSPLQEVNELTVLDDILW